MSSPGRLRSWLALVVLLLFCVLTGIDVIEDGGVELSTSYGSQTIGIDGRGDDAVVVEVAPAVWDPTCRCRYPVAVFIESAACQRDTAAPDISRAPPPLMTLDARPNHLVASMSLAVEEVEGRTPWASWSPGSARSDASSGASSLS